MIRGFLFIFVLTGLAIVAFLGFRGQTSTGSPIELFPDMVRQLKVRAQATSGFFAAGRGTRVPVAGTVPIGYDMPKPGDPASPTTSPAPARKPEVHKLLFNACTH